MVHDEDEAWLAGLEQAATLEPVLRALEDLFRRNSHADDAAPHPPEATRLRELALQTVRALTDPASAWLADVGGLRFHLWVPSAVYPGPPVIHASTWDEDAEVWRGIGEVVIEAPRA